MSPEKQLDVLDKEYVSVQDLTELYGWGRTKAKKEFDAIWNKIDEEQTLHMFVGHTKLIPISRILEKYPMNYNRLVRALKRKATTR